VSPARSACRTIAAGPAAEAAAGPAEEDDVARSITTQLMFQGRNAEEAMRFYVSLFEDAAVASLERFGPEDPEREGTVKRATFVLAGTTFACTDSPPVHDFTFTPSMSLFVECGSAEELDRLCEALSEDGNTFMPVADYGFSRRFAWVGDRFGVSWQLNLA